MIKAICLLPIVVNLSGLPWSKKDEASKNQADYTCRVRYNGCLKKFIKKEKDVYYAICKERNEKG